MNHNHISIYTDPVVTCPYNKSHRIAMSKIQGHIVKCEKNYPPGYKLTCPYNATHRLFDHELEDHIKTCPQRKPLDPDETYQLVQNHGSQMSEFVTKSIIESNLDHGESWDDEFQPDCSTSANECLDFVAQPESKSVRDPDAPLRLPRGYSEVMMMGGDSDVSEISDMESVVSLMGVGRGRMNPSQIELFKNRFGFGRGKPLTKN